MMLKPMNIKPPKKYNTKTIWACPRQKIGVLVAQTFYGGAAARLPLFFWVKNATQKKELRLSSSRLWLCKPRCGCISLSLTNQV
jgi:hypothetical protein